MVARSLRSAAGALLLGAARARRGGRRGRLRPRRGAGLAALALVFAVGTAQAQDKAQRVDALLGRLTASVAGERSAIAEELHESMLALEAALLERAPTPWDARVLTLGNVAISQLPETERPDDYDPLERFQVARLLAIEGDDLASLPWLSENLVGMLMRRDELEEAQTIVEEDLELVDEPGFRARHTLRLAQIARAEGALDEAEQLLEEVEAAGLDDPRQRANLLGTQVEVYLALGLRDRAARAVEEEVGITDELDSIPQRARALLHRAQVLLAIEQLDRVTSYVWLLRREEDLWSDVDRANLDLILALAETMQVRRGEEQPEVAASSLRAAMTAEGLRTGEREMAGLALADVLLYEMELWANEREPVPADLALIPDYPELAESGELLARPSTSRRRTRERLETDAYRAALRHRHATFAGDEDARRKAHAELREAWDSFLDSWRSIEPRPGGVGFLEYGSRRIVISELVRATLAESGGEEGAAAALEHVLEAQELGSFARRNDYRSRPLAEVVGKLTTRDQGLLVYLAGHGETHVFAVDSEKVVHTELAAPGELQRLGRTWLDELDRRPRADLHRGRGAFLEPVRPLADALLPASVRARLARWEAVAIVGQSSLGHVPFEFLPFEDGFLGDAKVLWNLPSLPMGVLLEERSPSTETETDLVLVTDPAFGKRALESIQPIPFEAKHLDRLVRGFPEERRVVFTRDAATRESLLDPRVPDARVLHLFTHGIDLADRSRDSGLVLAPVGEGDPGFLDCELVESSVESAQVVFLSACRAGSGRTRLGEDGPAHLGGAFLWAGAQVVVLSPVALELEAQSLFAEIFDRRLLAGDTVAEAVRHARVELAKDPRWAHPYYTRVHVLGLGDTRPFPRER